MGSSLLLTLSGQNVTGRGVARPLRIEYSGTLHHAMNRGRRAEQIFHDKHGYQVFIELLEESTESKE